MTKTILITGSTDGIGFETAKALYAQGHRIVLHGRSATKLAATEAALRKLSNDGQTEAYLADISSMTDVVALGEALVANDEKIDVVINNAGVFHSADTFTDDGLDMRFAVNTLAPCLLTQRLLPLLQTGARVVNLSSAAQSPVDLEALAGKVRIPDQFNAYAQSKLALTMWSATMARLHQARGLIFVAVNPGSLLATKMVKEGFGRDGNDIRIGSDILVRAALGEEFADASGKYFDNDKGGFGPPHLDALDSAKTAQVVDTMSAVLADLESLRGRTSLSP
tara:strand:+ start:679 stop:1518 length:840 start_codon:yes stop_codon:yes gene_type:complete